MCNADDRIDALGVEHPVAVDGVRIVSLVPSITELLFALGLGRCVVGRTDYCVHPKAQVSNLPSVGGTKKVRLDRLRELRPTHVVANIEENVESDTRTILKWGTRVIVTYPREPADNVTLFRLLGGIFAKAHATARLCDAFEARHSSLLEQRTTRPARRVAYLIWRKPWMTVCNDTYIGQMLALINWHTPPSVAGEHYPQLRAGDAALNGVDRVLFSSEPFAFKPEHLDEFGAAFGIAANRLVYVDGELMSWYGSRAVRGLEYLETLATRVVE